MATRGEMHSERIACSGRSYFFNVKENRTGDTFVEIVESKPTEAHSFDRRSIVIFREDMRDFLAAFDRTLGFLEKQPSKRRKPADPDEAPTPRKRVLKTKPKDARESDRERSGSLVARAPRKRVVVKKED